MLQARRGCSQARVKGTTLTVLTMLTMLTMLTRGRGSILVASLAAVLCTVAAPDAEAQLVALSRSTLASYTIDPGAGRAIRSDTDLRSTGEAGTYTEASQVIDSLEDFFAQADATIDSDLQEWDGETLSAGGIGSVAIDGSADAAGFAGAETSCNASSKVEFPFAVTGVADYDFDATLQAGVANTGAEVSALTRASLCQEHGGCPFFEVELGGPREISRSGELSEGTYILLIESSAELTVTQVGSATASASYDFDFVVVPEPRPVVLQLAAAAALMIAARVRRAPRDPETA